VLNFLVRYVSQGTKAVEGLALKLRSGDAKCFSTKAFDEMKKLRLLQLAGVQLYGDFKYLSRKLKWLSWNGFPLRCIPTNLYQGNLVSIELENSNLNLVWKETQVNILISVFCTSFVVSLFEFMHEIKLRLSFKLQYYFILYYGTFDIVSYLCLLVFSFLNGKG